ncbi:MAG: hypothetical protein IJJ23_11240, partial [Clostridia bacterium]|nr:hypothetical protein [Clostridia bacterium]
ECTLFKVAFKNRFDAVFITGYKAEYEQPQDYMIRTAVSLGGDCDTLTCIAGGIAEAYYGVPPELKAECLKRLPDDMRRVLERFDAVRAG